MRNVLSWVCAIAVFILLMNLSFSLSEYIEIPEELLGTFNLVLSGMISYRIALLIQQKKLSEENRIVFNSWILGLILMNVLTGLIYKAFDDVYSKTGEYLKFILEISAFAGTLWVTKQFYDKKKTKYKNKLKKDFERYSE